MQYIISHCTTLCRKKLKSVEINGKIKKKRGIGLYNERRIV